MKNFYLFVLLSLSQCMLNAQVSFDQGNDLIGDNNTRSTLSVGIADLNGDFKDDIVILDHGKNLIVGYQNGKNSAFRMVESGEILDNAAWALSVGDLDNDGQSELFACGVSTYGNIFKMKNDGSFGFIQRLYGLTFPQNSNMADINNDGWLDLFVCDERAYNDLYLNDQTGFQVYNDFINMYTIPESDNSGNYGSEWVDFDDDRDLDLFITKCKPAIESPESPLRLNVLFRNDGNNNYSEVADEYGLKNGAQSWTGSFADFDNDGDLDCFVSNHDTTHIIYRNIENDTFVDVTLDLIPDLRSASFQASLRDWDNNGFMDIYVTGDKDYMLWNKGNDLWEIAENPFDKQEVFTFATGDLNDDGFLDVITGYGTLNEIGDYDDKLWINAGNDNHYLKMSFLGDQSNLQGIGAKVKAYSELGIQIRDVKIGESYGTTNSANVHFGLGAVEKIDSLIVYWPSGIEDRFYDLNTDQHILVQEGKCIVSFFDISYEDDNILCEGESIQLNVPEGYHSWSWSNGENSESITVSTESNVYVTMLDDEGCLHHSNILKVWLEPDEKPEIDFLEGSEINCSGEEVVLSTQEANAYLWNNGSDSQTLEVVEDGSYQVSVQGHCQEFTSEMIVVSFLDSPLPILEEDSIFLEKADVLTLHATGDSILWFSEDDFINPIGIGVFTTDTIHTDTTFYVSNLVENLADNSSFGMMNHMGTPLGSSSLNSGLVFNCWESMVLEGVKVKTVIEGKRVIELRQINPEDGSQEVLASREVQLVTGEQYVSLNFEIDPGLDYVLGTNSQVNIIELGNKSPELYRSNQGVAFPYQLEGIAEMTSSLHGFSYYYYFFDWKVRLKSISCLSDFVPLYIEVDTVSAIEDLKGEFKDLINVYPNPVGDLLNIEVLEKQNGQEVEISIVDMTGKILLTTTIIDKIEYQTGNLLPGNYIIHSNTGNKKGAAIKLVVSEK